MEKRLIEIVTAEQVLTWLVIAFLVGYFFYKEWPEFKRRISGRAVSAAQDAAQDKSVLDRLTTIEEQLKTIQEKLERDYNRLNDMERWRGSMSRMVADSLEEREILMRAMLGVLGGLQEIGANGPTKTAENTIRDYLNRKAHAPDD